MTIRIEFCGGIGAGKSTCAGALAARWSLPLVAERFEDIPYWAKFYRDPAAYAIEKDVSFLLSHVESIRAATAPLVVCDFAMMQTVSYSVIAGDAADTVAVEAFYRRLAARVGHPSLMIRLRCTTNVQLRRIRARGRGPEAAITGDYLDRLDAAIDGHLRALLPATVPVIELDAAACDPASLIARPEIEAALAALTRPGTATTSG